MLSQAMAQRIEHWLVEKFLPFARSPRLHSDAQVAQIDTSTVGSGFNNPILVDTNGPARMPRAQVAQVAQGCEGGLTKPTFAIEALRKMT
jgi:hypothetical protein